MTLVVNASNIATACVNVLAMEAAGTPCMLISLTKFFVSFMDLESDTLMCSDVGGGDHVHLTLFRFYDKASLYLAKYATNVENQNVVESARPASDLDLTYAKKAALVTKNICE